MRRGVLCAFRRVLSVDIKHHTDTAQVILQVLCIAQVCHGNRSIR